MKKSIVVAAALVTFGCGSGERSKPKPADTAPVPVKTVAVESVEWPAVYEATGTVRARTSAVISAKVMGHVREVKVQTGDHVRALDLLVLIDARDLDAAHAQAEAALGEARSALPEASNAIASAKAQLELAQVTLRRMKDLFDKRSVSNQEFDEAAARLRVAEAGHQMALARRSQVEQKIRQAEEAVKSAAIMRGYAEIRAPFAGAVTEKRVEPGNLAAPGAPLLTLEQAGAYRLEALVEESRLPSIRTGQAVTVELDAFDKTISARVSEIVPAVDASSRAFTVKIDLPAIPNLRSGVFGRARFPMGVRKVLAIPAGAVAEQGQVQSALVAEEGAARVRLLTVGARTADRVEVLSGLSAGERVIFPRPTGLADGTRIEARP